MLDPDVKLALVSQTSVPHGVFEMRCSGVSWLRLLSDYSKAKVMEIFGSGW